MARASVAPQQARVLVVEDDPNNRVVIVRLLGRAGVPAANILECAGDPLPMVQGLAPEAIDLVLLDLQLPGKDGYAVFHELRRTPATGMALIVAVTANVMQADLDRTREAGFDGFIGKPLKVREFPQRLAEILAGQPVWSPGG